MFVGEGKARFDIDVGRHDGTCGNLKARVNDEVEIEAVVISDKPIMPISNVETSTHIVEREELRPHSGVDVYVAPETDFC